MKVQEQKEISFEVLIALKCIDSEAIIAGGAPRNWYFGELARDIDCYLRWHVKDIEHAMSTLSRLLGVRLVAEQVADCNYHFGGDAFHCRYIIAFKYKDVLFHIIIIQEAKPINDFEKTIVSHMDIGINMISCNWWRSQCLYFNPTTAFADDLHNKTLTLFQNMMNKEQLQHCITSHLPKMMSYYPDYQLKISGVK